MNDFALPPKSSDFAICHECDVLMRQPNHSISSSLRCPRCSSPVKKTHDSEGLAKPLAAVAAGLLFFWPANFLPILQMTILGIESNHTMIGDVGVMATSQID